MVVLEGNQAVLPILEVDLDPKDRPQCSPDSHMIRKRAIPHVSSARRKAKEDIHGKTVTSRILQKERELSLTTNFVSDVVVINTMQITAKVPEIVVWMAVIDHTTPLYMSGTLAGPVVALVEVR